MSTVNDLLLYNKLCITRSLNIKSTIQDKLLLNLYCSLELSSKNQLKTNKHKAAILSLDIENSENRYLLASGADRLSLFDLHSKSLLNSSKWFNGKGKVHKYSVTSIKWYPFDSGMFISGALDGNVILWDTNIFDKVLTFNIKKKILHISINKSIQSHNPLIAVASNQYNIYLCDVLSHSFTHSLIGHTDIVRCVAFNPFNEYILASGSKDGCIRIWDIRKAGALLVCDYTNLHSTQLHKEYFNVDDEQRINKKNMFIQSHFNNTVSHIQWSNNYKFHLYSSGTDKKIRKWRINIDANHKKQNQNHKAMNTLINFRPIVNENLCQKFIVSENDKFLFYPNNCDLSMFNTENGEEVNKFKGHFSCIYALSERKKYQQIVSGDIHGNILIFSPRQNIQKEIHEIEFASNYQFKLKLQRPPSLNIEEFNEVDQDNWSDD
eukprot:459912_1